MKCIKLCSSQHRDLALKYEKIRIGTSIYYANIDEPVLKDDEEDKKKFKLSVPVKLTRKELKSIGSGILCDIQAGAFVQGFPMMDYFVFSCTSIDGDIKKRAELLNKDAGYKITNSLKFLKLVGKALSQYLNKDNQIPSFKYNIKVSGPIQYNDGEVFQSKPEFFSRINNAKENPDMLRWALTKPESHTQEEEYRFMWMFADKYDRATGEAHVLNLPYDHVDLTVLGLKNIIKRISF